MKRWFLIRTIRYLFSPRWAHFNRAIKNVRKAMDRAIADVPNADAHVAVASSWLEQAEQEWKRLQAIRDGEE